VQEALGQLKILLLLFIFGQENLNSIYPHETAKSHIPVRAIPITQIDVTVSTIFANKN
jgi:hypothetical protein